MSSRIEIALESSQFPADRLDVIRVSGREQISQLFRFEIVAGCREAEGLDAAAVPGSTATLVFSKEGIEVRRIHGMIAQVTDVFGFGTGEHPAYRFVFVPRAFLLTLVETNDVFVDTSVPDIIVGKAKLVNMSVGTDIEMRLSGSYPAREFVVQYGEKDLFFVSRLAEHDGVAYFFDQNGGCDRMVFTDNAAGFSAIEGALRARFHPNNLAAEVTELEVSSRLIPALYVVDDYDYEKPLTELSEKYESPLGSRGGVLEYGPNFKDPAIGAQLARVRGEEREVEALWYDGKSTVCALTAGGRFVVEGEGRIGERDLLVVEVVHEYNQSWLGTEAAEQAPGYRNVFRAVPGGTTYRPPRVTPRPRIAGVVNGVVEAMPGVSAPQPWIDSMGRYLVRLLFDTVQPGERKASLPIRMAQSQAGPNHGFHFPLRPGIEVILVFVNGDPDRPVIAGAVPNAVTPSPVAQGDRTRNRIRTYAGVMLEMHDEV